MIVTVVHACPGLQHVIRVEVDHGATVEDAITAAGLLRLVPGLAEQPLDVGVWNHRATLATVLRDGDRIEVYRPLQVEPMQARRIRAEVRRRRRPGA